MNSSNDQHIVALNYLSDIMKKISRSKDLKESLYHIFEFTKQLLNYTMMVIYFYDDENEELKVVAAQGASVENLKKRTKFKVGEGVVGWVAKEKKAIVLEDATKADDFKVRQYYKEDPLIKSFMAVPLIYENKVLGIISISHNDPGMYNEKDVQMMSIIASQVAAIVKINKLLQDRTQIHKHILQSINSGVMVIDGKKNITLLNKAAEEIIGYSRKELIGKKISFLKESPCYRYIIKTLTSKRPFYEVETTVYCKDKRKLPIVMSTTVLKNSAGDFLGVTTIFRDISEFRKLQEEIQRTERLASLGKLAAGVAHEIRNPLLPIRTAANYLLKKIPVEDENYLLINTICEESERLNKLLNNFISFAKPSSSKDVFELNNLILETVALMKPEFESKNILLKLDLTDDRSKILASVQEIRQVLINLLLNAVDSMPCGGAISIETATDPEFLTLSISDTGCGMSEEQKKNAFDPFFTTKKDGTGLGLFIVHNLVLKNDGKIYLRSKEGEGTTFTIKIKRHI